jgi:hypothetical protein
MMKITTRINPVEINGEEIKGILKKEDELIISSHWNRNDIAVIDFHGQSVTVTVRELEQAIENAVNH